MLAAALLFIVSTIVAISQAPHPDAWRTQELTGLDWWRYPIERNGWNRLPHLPSGLTELHSLPGSEMIWASSLAGVAVKSVDGGLSWSEPTASSPAPITSVSFVDEQLGWGAAGSEILATTDGGGSWQEIADPLPGSEIRFLQFVDQQSGWAIADATHTAPPGGSLGGLFVTTDGGRNWEERVQPGFAPQILDTAFLDAETGWALLTGGALLVTVDGARSWSEPRPQADPGFSPLSIAMVDADQGWAVGSGGGIFATFDGGMIWRQQRAPKGDLEETLSAVDFVDPLRGWAVGNTRDGGIILSTVDGGVVWEPYTDNLTHEELLDVAFIDRDTGWVLGRQGTILGTKDGGGTWHRLTAGPKSDFESVTFVDELRGFIVGGGGTILATDDGGETWQSSPSQTLADLRDVAFFDDRRGFAVGVPVAVVRTDDGGETWQPRQTADTSSDQRYNYERGLLAVDFVNSQRAVAVGSAGALFITSDGGTTWRRPRNRLISGAFDLTFVGQRGWAADGPSGLHSTVNGGDGWATDDSLTRALAVSFVDQSRGWIAGVYEMIFGTSDGGTTWKLEHDGSRTLNAITVLLDGRGWAVGDSGTILTTVDHDEWTEQETNVSASLTGVHFNDEEHGWVIGHNGTILATTDGGQTWIPKGRWEPFPAPWYYVSLLAVALALAPALRSRPPVPRDEVAQILVSDKPLDRDDPDALGLREIALGVSGFLRNHNTQPPLTLAVTGEWGSGKSSLMNLLRRDLEDWGFRPVWFNAWHYQKEDHLLVSLLENIRSQAVPEWWRLTGWAFRLRLLRIRARRHAAKIVALAAFVGFVARVSGLPTRANRRSRSRRFPRASSTPPTQPCKFGLG